MTQLDMFDQFAGRPEQPVGLSAGETPTANQRTATTPRVAPVTGQTTGQTTKRVAKQRVQRNAVSGRTAVLDYVRSTGDRGATREEIAEMTGMRIQTVCGRCSELLNPPDKSRPKLHSNGTTRIGSSGSPASVLYAVELCPRILVDCRTPGCNQYVRADRATVLRFGWSDLVDQTSPTRMNDALGTCPACGGSA